MAENLSLTTRYIDMSKIDLNTNIVAAKQSDSLVEHTKKVWQGKSPELSKSESAGKKFTKDTVPVVHMSRNNPRIVGDYNTVDMMEAEDAKQAKVEMWIAKAVGTELVNHYPNRQWGVQVDSSGGMVVITCPSLSKKHGYFVHMDNLPLAGLVAKCIPAAGEILERYGVSRARKFDGEQLDHMDRDFDDEVISSDAKPEPIHK